MFEKQIESHIIDTLKPKVRDFPQFGIEVIKYYSIIDIQAIYNEVEAKLGGGGQAIMVAVGEENRIAGSAGGTFYQVTYPINIILAGSFIKNMRNTTENRQVYEMKNICRESVFGTNLTINGTVRKIQYVSGTPSSVDQRLDLYLMAGKVNAHYEIKP